MASRPPHGTRRDVCIESLARPVAVDHRINIHYYFRIADNLLRQVPCDLSHPLALELLALLVRMVVALDSSARVPNCWFYFAAIALSTGVFCGARRLMCIEKRRIFWTCTSSSLDTRGEVYTGILSIAS